MVNPESHEVELDTVAVKSPQFSYSRIKGADPQSKVEMASTGEVACFGDTYPEALLKSMMALDPTITFTGVAVKPPDPPKPQPELKPQGSVFGAFFNALLGLFKRKQ